MFEKARLKLTIWYTAIIMLVSLVFSLSIYLNINSEYVHIEEVQERFRQEQVEKYFIPKNPAKPVPTLLNPEIIEHARLRLISTLSLINLSILALAAASGYFLSGRTLRPIKNIVDEQKRFISDSSHELRTPITSLRTELEVGLRDKKLTTKKAKEILKSNLEEIINLQNLTNNLLSISQNGEHFNTKHKKISSLKKIVNNALDRVKPLAIEKKITFEIDIKEVKLNVVEDRIQEVFVIILENAIKFSKYSGKIIIESSKIKNEAIVKITDFGIGIDGKDLPYIFDRFYRADKSRTIKGHGLGLSIAKRILEKHKGKIYANSKSGKTTFTIVLPL